MSASVPRDLATSAPARPAVRRHSVPLALRLGIGLDRSMWPVDRGLAELRWAALTVGFMLAMALPAHLLADTTGAYLRATFVSASALLVIGGLAWSPWAPSLVRRTVVRRGIGPLVMLVALAAAGAYDPGTLESPIGRPFIILGLTFAALTPGFSIAAGIVALASFGLLINHAMQPGLSLVDQSSVDFAVRASVTFLAAGADPRRRSRPAPRAATGRRDWPHARWPGPTSSRACNGSSRDSTDRDRSRWSCRTSSTTSPRPST